MKAPMDDKLTEDYEKKLKKTPIKLNISKKDLLNAGYDRNYKFWSE
jgi:hypothetical protein